MTTTTWSSGNSHTTDVEFRTWGSEFSAKLALCGLIQTADTGQVNWGTVLRPAANVRTAYEVWRFNDSLQGTAPIFLKFYFGTSTSANGPSIGVEIGTATNGAGTLSGIGSGTIIPGNYGDTVAGTTTPTPSYFCHTEGFFGYVWKRGSSPQGQFCLSRTCTAAGVPDIFGYTVTGYGGFSATATTWLNLRHVRFAATAVVALSLVGSSQAWICLMPTNPTTSTTLQNGDKQFFLGWGGYPEMRPIFAFGCYAGAEFAAGTTFVAKTVGTTDRTFLASGIQPAPGWCPNNAGSFGLGMLWE